MNLLVDTSVWSLALRRDRAPDVPEVEYLVRALSQGEAIFTTGLILQELLQGFRGPKARDRIVERFAALPLLVPNREDHVEAAGLCNACRRRGIQVGTIDALLAQLAIRHALVLLTTDRDFEPLAELGALELWRG